MSFRRTTLVALVLLLGGLTVPAYAAWPTPDDNVLPLLRDDTVAGSASAAYRVTATDGAPFAFEVARNSNGGSFHADLVQIWRVDGTGPVDSFLATTSGQSLTRVHVTSDPLAVDTETQSQPGGPAWSTGSVQGQLPAGSYFVVMAAGGDQPSTDTTFHLHGVNLTVEAASFGPAIVAGPEQFRGVANATALASTATVAGHVATSVTHALSGLYSAYETVSIYTGPTSNGPQPVLGAATFINAPAGSYDFTALAAATPPVGNFSPILVIADVAVPTA